MAVEFLVKPEDLLEALTFIRPNRLRTRQARRERVDIYARKSEIEFASTSASLAFRARVISPGKARARFGRSSGSGKY